MGRRDQLAALLLRALAPAIRDLDTRLRRVEQTFPTDLVARLRAYEQINTQLEARVTSLESQYAEQVGALIGIVIAENASLEAGIALKDQALNDANTLIQDLQGRLNSADADKATAVAQGISAALDADSAADAERMKAYLDQLAAAVPQDVPPVEVPEPGVPAEPPPDSDVEVPATEPTDQTF